MEELLKHNLEEGYYYMYQPNLIIKLPITDIAESDCGIALTLGDDNGELIIFKEASEVRRVRRPDNIIGNFEWCYLIKNEYKEPIGYIGK